MELWIRKLILIIKNNNFIFLNYITNNNFIIAKMGGNKKNLKKRSTFEQVLNIVKEDKPVINDLPNRFSTQLRDSQKYQNLISDDLSAVHEHQEKIAKHQVLQQT